MEELVMKKRLLAVVLASLMAFSVSGNVSAEWKRDDASNWSWSENGSLQVGWKYIEGKWYYFNKDGIMKTGWILDGDTWYYLEPNGAMKTGWLLYEGSWYYLNPNGVMAKGWILDGGAWYYLGSNGVMKTGWQYINQSWYYLSGNGQMQTGWRYEDSVWHYLYADGRRASGWIEINGKRYFLDDSGVMQDGMIEIDKKVYYFDFSGAMVTGKVTVDGKRYEFAASGESVGLRVPKPEKAFNSQGAVAEITIEGGFSSSGVSSGGGSSGGSGSNGDSDNTEQPSKPDFKILVEGGSWKDTEEGLQFITNEGMHINENLTISYNTLDYCVLDSYQIYSLEINNLLMYGNKPMEGKLTYALAGEKIDSTENLKQAILVRTEIDEETGILSLQYQNLEMSCNIRLKISDNNKCITLLDFSSSTIVGCKSKNVFVNLDVLSDDTVSVYTEQDVRSALENEQINCILIGESINFENQLVINRDITIMGGSKHKWKPGDTWKDGNKALVSIQNNATVVLKAIKENFDLRPGYGVDVTLIEVKNAVLEADGVEFANDGLSKRLMYLENATVRLFNCGVGVYSNTEVGIEMDTLEGSSSTLEIIGGRIQNVDKHIISGSKESIVTLPDAYVEFINEEGQREWTNDPNRLPSNLTKFL